MLAYEWSESVCSKECVQISSKRVEKNEISRHESARTHPRYFKSSVTFSQFVSLTHLSFNLKKKIKQSFFLELKFLEINLPWRILEASRRWHEMCLT